VVHATLTDENYWTDRLAESDDGKAVLTDFATESGVTRVAVSMSIASSVLPARAARARPLGVTFDLEEVWQPLHGDGASGVLRGSLAGAPVRIDAEFRLESDTSGATVIRQHGRVQSGVPVFGRMIEDGLCEKVAADFRKNCEFTEGWAARPPRGSV
jgi:hypothetical protein